MDTTVFYNNIKIALKNAQNEILPNAITLFLNSLKNIYLSQEENILKITKMTILFEGFYNFLLPISTLKKKMTQLRIERWENHFGTPTVTFLISYQEQINNIAKQFQELNLPSIQIEGIQNLRDPHSIDQNNNVIINLKKMNQVMIPDEKEKTGQFVKTHNPSGGFTTAPCDEYSKRFIEYAVKIAKKGGKVLEIGAAFGAASLDALAKGATVFCNDINAENLAVIHHRYRQEIPSELQTVTGDTHHLALIPGSFPEELSGLPKESFDAILVCRVLHFFPGKKIEESLQLFSKLLKPGGKLFIICETPFLKNWQKFIPEYETRSKAGIEWPGEITNPNEFESSGRAATLPPLVHWITKDILNRSLKKTNFEILKSSYINRSGQFPNDLIFDGKESVGAEAIKQLRAHL